jgi:hypothetical protein
VSLLLAGAILGTFIDVRVGGLVAAAGVVGVYFFLKHID